MYTPTKKSPPFATAFRRNKANLTTTLMYHPRIYFTVLRRLVLFSVLFGGFLFYIFSFLPKTNASNLTTNILSRQLVGSAELGNAEIQSQFGFIPQTLTIKTRPNLVIIYETDNVPLGSRRPFLLVHGLRGEYYPLFRWGMVLNHLQANPEFRNKYKVYLARYDTIAPLAHVVPQMQKALALLYNSAHERPISVLALSIGGNLLYEAMLDKKTDAQVSCLFTLGTPFRGSPLFCQDWVQYSILKNFCMPWTKVDHSLAYHLYFRRNPNLLKDYGWDNCDQAIPDIGHFASLLPFGPKGNLMAESSYNKHLQNLDEQGFDKSKLITYSGFLLNPYLQSCPTRLMRNTLLTPYMLLSMKIPAHLGLEHPVLNLLNRQISTVLTTKVLAQQARTPFVYGLNDGITPVTSAIFLKKEALSAHACLKESDLLPLKEFVDVHTARVFRNVDHLTFIDGYHPPISPRRVKDELNPQAGERDIFSWILLDICNFDSKKNTPGFQPAAQAALNNPTDNNN